MIKNNKYGISKDDVACLLFMCSLKHLAVGASALAASEQPDNPGAERYTKSHSSG